ncbi:unnamed protein product [Oikopleura dioica]|uniref:Uncharacterized protein n=1 Tax=Oikopleura dioica TaxID=34765 RepID=E4XZP9_OIKDI|nr:unnamed protein product [Oikopleura dioica]
MELAFLPSRWYNPRGFDHGVQFGPKTESESEAKRMPSAKSDAKRSEFASLSLFFAIKRIKRVFYIHCFIKNARNFGSFSNLRLLR